MADYKLNGPTNGVYSKEITLSAASEFKIAKVSYGGFTSEWYPGDGYANVAIGAGKSLVEFDGSNVTVKPYYTITWKDGEGNLIDTTEVLSGETPEHAELRKAGYHFASWNPQVVLAVENATYTAVLHQLTAYEAHDATCTEPGNIAYWSCADCDGMLFKDQYGAEETTRKDVETSALGHNYEAVVTPPTCTEQGYTTHACSRCEDYYFDTYVPSTDHDWDTDNPVWGTPEVNGSVWTASVTLKCKNCTATNLLTAQVIGNVTTVTATCAARGYKRAIFAADFNDEHFEQEIKWGETEIDASSHAVELVEHEAHEATCTEAGNSAYWYCPTCEKYFSDEGGTAMIDENSWITPATGIHTYENGVCTVCGAVDPAAAVAKIGDEYFATLQAAIDAAQQLGGEVTVKLIADISESATIKEAANFKLTIDGAKANGGRYTITDATITIDGLRGAGGDINNGAAVTLQNIDFVKTTTTAAAINAQRYPHDVTIQNCSFTGTDANNTWWAIVTTNDSAYRWTLTDLTFEYCRMLSCKSFNTYQDNAMYGLVATNLVGTNVYAGINNIKTDNAILIENCAITTAKYAFRDAPEEYAGTITLRNNTFTSTSAANDEGAIVVRGGAASAHVNVESGLYDGQLVVLNNKEAVMNITGGVFTVPPKDDYCGRDASNNQLYAVENRDEATKADYPYIFGTGAVAKVMIQEVDVGYFSFANAAAARTSNDDVIKLLENITDEYTLTVGEPNEILKVQHNDKTLTVKAPEGYALKNDIVGGVTTYTIAAIYTVTFNANGGSEVEAQQVEDGKTATQPTDPTKEHYTFQGWFSDEELTTAFAFDTPITANVTLYAKWVEAPYFKGHGLALGDAINVRFNLALPGGKDHYEGSYVEFTIQNATGTKRYETADAVQVANDPDNDNPRYRYVCPVNAIQMADMITPVFHYTVDGEERTVQGTPYAAKTYIDNHKNEDEVAYRNAVRATGDYGHFAQLYLHDVHQDTYGTHAEMPLYGSGSYDYNAIYGSLDGQDIVRPVVGDNMVAISYLLYCDSQTGIWLYLRLKDGYSGPTPTATYNGTKVDMSLNTADGRYRYKIAGSMASELDKMKNVTLTVGADSTVVKVSVLSWVRGSLDSNYNGSANEKDFASSLYWYWKAADGYLAAHH